MKSDFFPESKGCWTWPWCDILQIALLLFPVFIICEARTAIHGSTFRFPREGRIGIKKLFFLVAFIFQSVVAFDAFVFELTTWNISLTAWFFQSKWKPSVISDKGKIRTNAEKKGIPLLVTRKLLGIKIRNKSETDRTWLLESIVLNFICLFIYLFNVIN